MTAGLADIGAEGILLAGAGRAILLQIANPAVGRGVAEHSNFTERPLERFRATTTFLYAAMYGTREQVATVRRQVNRAHAPVHGGSDGQSQRYNAFDADLQLWVLATLYDSTVTVYELVYGPLPEAVADAIYRDYGRIGTMLQVPEGRWPSDRAAFADYWAAGLRNLTTDASTVRISRELLYPKAVPWWLQAAMPLMRLVTAARLPPTLRAGYGLPWSGRRQRRFDAVMRAARVVYPPLPQGVRHGLKNYYLNRLV